MNTNTPLINLAILESLKRNSQTDEIDLIVPYIVLAIAELEGESFDPAILKASLEKKFGFNPPPSAFDVIMSRVVKRKYVYRKNRLLFKRSEQIDEIVEKNRDTKKEVTIALTLLLKEFSDYAKNKFNLQISDDTAEIFLFNFINEHISVFAVSLEEGTYELTDKNIKNEAYLTSCFIRHLYENKIETIKHLDTIVKGALLANYLTLADTKASKQKLDNITVLLDTPLLLGLLGYNGNSKSKSLMEFLSLMQSLSIKVEMFDITIDEVTKVMRAWKQDLERKRYDDFNPKTLELLKSKGYDIAGLESEIILARKNLEKLGIKVAENKTYDCKYQCDVSKFEEFLRKRSGPRDLVHDIKCVSMIYSSREGKRIETLDGNFSVLITHESTFPKTVEKFFQGENDKVVGKIPIVSTEKWISTITWLKKPNAFPKMPIRLMVSSAYNIVFLDDKFWSSFITKLNKLKKRGDINEDDFNLVRWDSGLIELAHNSSITSGENYTDEDIFDVVNGIKSKITDKYDQEIDNLRNEHAEKIEQVKSNHEKDINTVSQDLKDVKENLTQVVSIVDRTKNKIHKIALFSSNLLSIIFCTLISAMVIWGLIISYSKYSLATLIGGICIGVLGILTFFNLFIGTEIKKTTLKIRVAMYKKIYKSLSSFLLK